VSVLKELEKKACHNLHN